MKSSTTFSITALLALAASSHAYLDLYGYTGQAAGPSGNAGFSGFSVTDSAQTDVCKGKGQGGFPDGVNDFCNTPIYCNNGNTVNMANGPCTGGGGDTNAFYANLYSGTDQSNQVGTCTYNYGQAQSSSCGGFAGVLATEIIKCSTTYC